MAIKDPLTHHRSVAIQFGAAGDHFCRCGLFHDARHMYERQISSLELDGASSLELVFPLLNAADACRSDGRNGAVRKFEERAFDILSTELGVTAVPGSVVLKKLASLLKARGQLRESAEMAIRIQGFLARENGRG